MWGLTRWLTIAAALMLLLVGAFTFWLPIPIGLPLLFIGMKLLLNNSHEARRRLVRLMGRYPRLRHLVGLRKKPPPAQPARN